MEDRPHPTAAGERQEEADISRSDAPGFVFPEGVLARQVDGEMVLLNLKSEQYYGLDSVGADIVDRLVKIPKDVAIAALCRDYDVDAEVLKQDVERLIGDLMGAGLLHDAHPPA